ncbi:MAG: IS630 family transposase [Mycobacteriales bacterium]
MVRRSSGSVVTWRRAQMVLLSAQGMEVVQIVQVTFTSADRVRDVLHNFNTDGFDSLRPKYAGGRPPKFDTDQRGQIKQIALARPGDHGLPFSTWSLSKLADYLVAQGVVDDISHEGLRQLLREQGCPFQAVKTWKTSTDPDYEAKKNRVLELYAIADGKKTPGEGDPTVVICMDEFGPLNLQPHPGKQWTPAAAGAGEQYRPRQRRRRATDKRPHAVRHLLAGYDLSTDRLYGHVVAHKSRTEFLAFCRYLRALHPAEVRIAIVLDNFAPHLSTKTDSRVGDWARENNVELAYVPFYGSWLNRIEAQFTALRYFALDGTDHPSHREQASMIRRYIIWRNSHRTDPGLRKVIKRAAIIKRARVA